MPLAAPLLGSWGSQPTSGSSTCPTHALLILLGVFLLYVVEVCGICSGPGSCKSSLLVGLSSVSQGIDEVGIPALVHLEHSIFVLGCEGLGM